MYKIYITKRDKSKQNFTRKELKEMFRRKEKQSLLEASRKALRNAERKI